MRRRAAIIAAAAAALGGGLLLAPSAQAEETCNGLAYDLDVVVNGDAVVDEAGCLSPDGGGVGLLARVGGHVVASALSCDATISA